MRRSVSVRLPVALLLSGILASGAGAPATVLGDSLNPPTILFAGEVASAPSYDHIALVYSARLDTSVPIPLGDFVVTVDGTPYAPLPSSSYLFSGLSAADSPFDPAGDTIIRLNLPVAVGPASSITVAYTPLAGPTPLRDLSLTNAAAQDGANAVTGSVLDLGPFALLAAVVDAGDATNHLTLLFTGQVDLTALPAPGDFAVTVNGLDDAVTVGGVKPQLTDLGLGIVDLVLTTPVPFGAVVNVIYTPGVNKFTARNGGLVLAAFSQDGVAVFVPPTSASGTAAPGGTIATTTDPPSSSNPVTAAVTTADGGAVTISQVAPSPAPTGYTFFGEQVQITAPQASDPTKPLVLAFAIDASLVPAGETAASIVVFRNGVALGDCATSPFPCVSSRTTLTGGGVAITVKTLAASTWNFGVVAPYAFGGFKSPVAGSGVRNLIKAGSAIPVKFSLGGNRGLSIFTAGSPASTRVACDTSAPLDVIATTLTAGASSLGYDAGADQYTYIWKTEAAWAGTCRLLALSFGDGSHQQVIFQFK